MTNPTEPKKRLVAVRIPDDDVNGVDDLAAQRGVTRSDEVRRAVAELLSRERPPQDMESAL